MIGQDWTLLVFVKEKSGGREREKGDQIKNLTHKPFITQESSAELSYSSSSPSLSVSNSLSIGSSASSASSSSSSQTASSSVPSRAKGAKSERAKKHVLEMIDVRNN